jgi:hypothetical protein
VTRGMGGLHLSGLIGKSVWLLGAHEGNHLRLLLLVSMHAAKVRALLRC